MKKIFLIPGLVAILLISGCIPTPGGQDEELIQDNEENVEETVIIPEAQLKDEYYGTLLPFKKSASRGLITDNIETKYDIREAEEGLLRLARQHFDPKDHYFQEGQYISEEMVRSWLGRNVEDDPESEGLNPETTEDMTEDEIAEKAPRYLAHIIEQNFLVMTKDKKVRLDGIAIGLAMNSIHYTASGKETKISDEELEKQGTLMGEEIIQRIRSQEGLGEIPIVVGLFKQNSRASIVPGTYFATTFADRGKAPSGWKSIDEKYVLFPTSTNDEVHREANNAFLKFKQSIDDYFPSFVNVIGRGFYKDGKLYSLTIEIPIQFYGTSETIGFTQYLVGLLSSYLPNVHTEVSVTSMNGPEALIIKNPEDEEPFVHIYGY